MSDYQQPGGEGWWQEPPTQPAASQGGWQPPPPPAAGGWPAQPSAYSPSGPSMGPPMGPPRRRRRRRRGLGLLITLVVIIVLLVAADFGAKAYAESQIADQIKSSGLQIKPNVTIQGFPFLTQVLSHDVHEIDISANNVQAGKYTISSIVAKATGVHLNSSFNGATIDHINGSATITFQTLENDLNNAIGIPGLSFATITADGSNKVTASAGGGLASVTATVEQTGPNTITIHFNQLGGIASLLGGASTIPDQVITIPKLPAGLVVKSVSVTNTGIVATAAATHTTLSE